MSTSVLTPSALSTALAAIANAASEQECADTLVSAAAQIQAAILGRQEPASLRETFDSCPEEYGMLLTEAVWRCVDAFAGADGSELRLWLLPVTLTSAIPLTLPLALNSDLSAIRVGAALQTQLTLTSAQSPIKKAGWVYPVPALFTIEQVEHADLSHLVNLPHVARDVVRGDAKQVHFARPPENVAPGAHVFYIPVVSFSPSGTTHQVDHSELTHQRVKSWVGKSLAHIEGADLAVGVADIPRPFSLACENADLLQFTASFRNALHQVIVRSGVAANGMAALLSPYSTSQTDGALVLGVTITSRLTGQRVGMFALPTRSVNATEEMAAALAVLRTVGFERLQTNFNPISSQLCQHCGYLQYANPAEHIGAHGMTEAAGALH